MVWCYQLGWKDGWHKTCKKWEAAGQAGEFLTTKLWVSISSSFRSSSDQGLHQKGHNQQGCLIYKCRSPRFRVSAGRKTSLHPCPHCHSFAVRPSTQVLREKLNPCTECCLPKIHMYCLHLSSYSACICMPLPKEKSQHKNQKKILRWWPVAERCSLAKSRLSLRSALGQGKPQFRAAGLFLFLPACGKLVFL